MKNILNDAVYLGIVTQNRTGSRSYKDKTMIQKPETEWICHEDAHEAIVDREVWEAVQEKNRAVKQQVANHAAPLPALFTGKLVCADCGHPLVATRETRRRKTGQPSDMFPISAPTFPPPDTAPVLGIGFMKSR